MLRRQGTVEIIAHSARLRRLLAPDFHEYGSSGGEAGCEGAARARARGAGGRLR